MEADLPFQTSILLSFIKGQQHEGRSGLRCCGRSRRSVGARLVRLEEIRVVKTTPKEFKRIALRADKTDQSFTAMIHLAAAVINSR
jgi:hypothetical protein